MPACQLDPPATVSDVDAGQYVELLAESYRAVYASIVGNCNHKNRELKVEAFQALETFGKEVCRSNRKYDTQLLIVSMSK